jgi:hypothetical protein
VAKYRLLLFDEKGALTRGTSFTARDDAEAIRYATAAAQTRPAQLRSGDRLVWRQPPDNDG